MGSPLPARGDGQPAATHVRYLVLAGLCTATLIAYVHRNSIAVAEKTMRRDLGLSEEQMGLAMSAFFVTYAAAQIPGGWLGHVWGTRRTLPFCSVVGAAAMTVVALAGGLPSLLAGRLALGTAQAGMLPCSTGSVRTWFPATRRALASGALGSSLSIGGALGAALTGWLIEPIGWRWLFFLFALPAVAWAVWFTLWFRDRPQDHRMVNAAERELIGPAASTPMAETPHEPTPWLRLFTSPAMACICGQQFFRAAAYTFYASWFATFLQDSRGATLEEAGTLTSLALCGVVVGSLAGGVLSDWVLNTTGSRRLGRQGVAVASLLASTALILSARPATGAWFTGALFAAVACCSAFAGPCAYAISIDMGGRHVAPVFSTMNMSGNIGAMLFPLVVPRLIGPGRNWDLVLIFVAGIHVAAAVLWLCLNPHGTIFDRPGTAAPRD
jgi:ACS family glucarate transporter-like MFS transporter